MKLPLLFFLCLTYVYSFSQDSTKHRDSTRYYQHVQIGFGYQQQQFDNLNARIVRYFPRSVPQRTYSFSYGGKSVFNSILIQSDMGMSFAFNGSRNKGSTNAFLFNLNLDAGLFLNSPGAIRIYPFAGLGVDMASVSARIRTDNINFDSVLSNPVTRTSTEPVTMSNFFFSWRSGLAIDFGNPKRGNHPYTVGLKAGYKRSFNEGRWRFESNSNFTNAPSDRLEQWFASIVFYSPTSKMKKRSRSQ